MIYSRQNAEAVWSIIIDHALSKPCRVELYRLGKSVVRREARLNRSTRFQVESDWVESQAVVLQARKHMKKGWTILQALTISVELTSRVVFLKWHFQAACGSFSFLRRAVLHCRTLKIWTKQWALWAQHDNSNDLSWWGDGGCWLHVRVYASWGARVIGCAVKQVRWPLVVSYPFWGDGVRTTFESVAASQLQACYTKILPKSKGVTPVINPDSQAVGAYLRSNSNYVDNGS